MDPHNYNQPAYENRHDHGKILEELKSIRQDLNRLMRDARQETKDEFREVNKVVEDLREEVQEQRIKLTELSSANEMTKKAIYIVAAPALFVAISAMAKAMGFI